MSEQVHVRASSTRANGLKFENTTSIALKVGVPSHQLVPTSQRTFTGK